MGQYLKRQGLYDPTYEHDACGVAFVVNINGKKEHSIIDGGLEMLCNLEHRGAVGGDQKTGDGAGMMVQIPHEFFNKVLNFPLPEPGKYGVAFLFLPKEKKKYSAVQEMVKNTISQEGGKILGWREVPVNPDCLGDFAKKTLPSFWQLFITFEELNDDELTRKLFVTRKCLENDAAKKDMDINDFYISSLSAHTIIYKGMFVSTQFTSFYPDLTDEDFVSAMAMVHQRYSTNTFPSWPLAQPFRFVAHNGEINTLRGNINKISAQDSGLSSKLFGDDIKKIIPVVTPNASDSASFDNVFELLTLSGRSLEHSMMMMVPEAFGPKYHISSDKRAFFEYHAAIMDPWDGPAALTFSDGVKIGAYLDRNGLRPGRYIITKSGRLVLASEVGVLQIEPADVLEKGRLAPGKMLVVDTQKQRVIKDNEIKSTISRWKPYRRWLDEHKIELKGLFQIPGPVGFDEKTIITRLRAFGYTLEDLKQVITPMVNNSQEPLGSMGNDAALAVLSKRPQLLYNYFKQMFAQVTNPPIDPYRENLVMSLMSFVGRERNLLDETPEHCHQLKLHHPMLTNDDIERLKKTDFRGFKVSTVPMLFDIRKHNNVLEEGLRHMCQKVENKIDKGYSMVILSDREMSKSKAAIPALLAVSTVHQHLVRVSKRHLAALIVETGEAREVHHFATLLSYGASGINPYLVFESMRLLGERGYISSHLSMPSSIMHYITAVNKGLLKVMSKMGISTLRGYRHAQTYEALGLSDEFVEKYFPGTATRIGGIGLEIIEREARERHISAFKASTVSEERLNSGGNLAYRQSTEQRLFSPEAVVLLQKAVRENNSKAFSEYSSLINDHNKNLCTLRGLFHFKKTKPVPIEDVEAAESIVKRFVTSAMSLGSISNEAHETMAIAMNRIGAKSNSGEGGEDEIRYKPLPNGDSKKSKVKQIASARFGVTSNYLVNSEELQIKMAQGAKPGEGGQLPGFKVDEMIAKMRHSTPGVMLISPPPHHDIYSIEDLAQLIFDLKNANRDARVSVKLVSEVGVGTVAAGVAKAKADMVLISGGDGGTGASPLSSIKYAGSSWEIGLAETQQVLVMNKLRDRIRIQVDGQIKTGRDVVVGALIGAEEFGFGTTALVSMGCIMMRKCHQNTCPVGVATQNPELRKRFSGQPEHVINFMFLIANEVRELMAQLGFRSFDEMVGRVDILQVNKAIEHYKTKGLDFSRIFYQPKANGSSLTFKDKQDTDFSQSMDLSLIIQAGPAIEKKERVEIEKQIRNFNRTVGAMLSSEISKKYGSTGLAEDTIKANFSGSAGQSFGAFLAPGITFRLEGDANDYFGKGLSGGKLIIRPPKGSAFSAHRNIITGNVNLFGATSGQAYIRGMAGERFAVRNSGAIAVVEGVGDHACEYMTGGRVIVLGKTGVNFAAGMSGGIAYVLDENQLFDTRCNLEMVDIEVVSNKQDSGFLYAIIKRHVEYTGSRYASRILESWDEMLPLFVKVIPVEYRKALQRMETESVEEGFIAMTEEVYR
ncbi:MAG: glutamate synthase large subunit [Calditrichaeota bacterium]|nr:MAG: glutamate synthase large subunit [Calditrichota bacterium]MBL1205633.1 glutamate synthase large subunit [Calditrichota bacterium]NOG45461.1 glutamate synthase large subunit [Calditrichota bacterium]